MVTLQPPYWEDFTGRLVGVSVGKPALLVIGRGKLPPPGKLIYRGDVSIRFGFPLLLTTDHMFPQLVIDDFRREFHGRAAIEFMLNKGNSYPRADAVGMRLTDGSRGDFYMKEVDIAAGLHAYAYAADLDGPPLARVGAVVWLDTAIGSADGVLVDADAAGSLLHFSAKCYRCNPALLSELLARSGQAGNP